MTREDVLDAKAYAEAATQGPWFFNSYSGIFSTPISRAYDAAEALIPDDAPDEAYKGLPNPVIAHVPVRAGDTATTQGAKDAVFIAGARSDIPALADALLRVLALADGWDAEKPSGGRFRLDRAATAIRDAVKG